ncbi:MAG: NACHT domain-containing protein, partial [Chloroflexi bacterium]|nr:NACHT domain-containing protein [Chloroflexota bacterium]
PHFKGRSRHLKENSKYAVAIALGLTLDNAALTAGDLLGMRLKEDRLVAHLTKKQPKAVAGLNQAERGLYALMLKKASAEIMQIATTLTGYDLNRDRRLLDDNAQILAGLEHLFSESIIRGETFERKYKSALIDELDVFEDFGVAEVRRNIRRQTLDVAFVHLGISSRDRFSKKPEQIEMVDGEISGMGRAKQSAKNPPPTFTPGGTATSVERALFSSRRHIIEGKAGSGKSTLLQWIAVQSAGGGGEKRIEGGAFGDALASWNHTVPFFIRLRACLKDGLPRIEAFPEYLDDQLGGKPEHWVHDQFDSHRAIILLDGMDELPEAKRPETLKGIKRLVRNYPAARYIISSRPAALEDWPEWHEWAEKEKFITSSLEEMNDSHLELFVEHWHNALKGRMGSRAEEKKLQSDGKKLPALLNARRELKNLARTPLLAAMICAMNYELNGHL